jgi:hypothetical protein
MDVAGASAAIQAFQQAPRVQGVDAPQSNTQANVSREDESTENESANSPPPPSSASGRGRLIDVTV